MALMFKNTTNCFLARSLPAPAGNEMSSKLVLLERVSLTAKRASGKQAKRELANRQNEHQTVILLIRLKRINTPI